MMRHSIGSVRTAVVSLAVAVAFSGCASVGLRQAQIADELRDHDLAVAQYMKVLREHPDNREARAGLERAKLRAAEGHLFRGRRLAALGKHDDAVAELQLAFELNPTSGDTERELRAARAAQRAALTADTSGQTALESLLYRAGDLRPLGPQLPEMTLPALIITARQATSRDLYMMVGALAKLSVTFDPQFREAPAQVSLLGGLPLKDALDAIAKTTNTFYQLSGPATIIVVNDTPQKRREYLEEYVTTLFLRNADLKETSDALRVTVDIRNLAPITAINAIAIKDTADRLALANRVVRSFDKARPEVVVEVEVLQVDRTRLREYGLQIATPGSLGLEGSLDANKEGQTLQSIRNLTQADVLVTNIPALYYRLLKTDTNTRTVANPHIRMSDGIKAVAEFGDSVPIPSSVIQPPAQGGVSTVPITAFNYRNIGVNIAMTPRTHANDDVTLTLLVELTTSSGEGFGGLPQFGNRKVETTIRLRDGETNILAGLIRDDERYVRDGIPGLSDLPGLGRLFARNRKESQQTDVVIMLTPHILRGLQLTEDDLRPVRVPREGGGAVLIESLPAVPPPPIIRDKSDVPPPPSLPVTSGPPAGLPVTSGPPAGLPVTPVPPPPKVIR